MIRFSWLSDLNQTEFIGSGVPTGNGLNVRLGFNESRSRLAMFQVDAKDVVFMDNEESWRVFDGKHQEFHLGNIRYVGVQMGVD